MNAKDCLDIVSKQEKDLVFNTFDYDDAYRLGATVMDIALKENLAIATEIVLNGFQVFRAARPGTSINNERWMENKRNTMMYTNHSSLHYCYRLAAEGKARNDALFPEDSFAICGGGFPIALKGTGIIGYLCVSGLQHEEDHRVMVDAISTFLGVPTEKTPVGSGF